MDAMGLLPMEPFDGSRASNRGMTGHPSRIQEAGWDGGSFARGSGMDSSLSTLMNICDIATIHNG